MLTIIGMSVLSVVLCIAFFCTLNGNVCEKAWKDGKEKLTHSDDSEGWEEMYDGN